MVFTLLGVAVGSFLYVCIDRLPDWRSLISPPSRCPACQRRLAFGDLIPVVSYLLLRGRCRYCGAHIPGRLLWVELATGLLFGLLWWHYGSGVQLGVLTAYGCLFIIISVIDLEQGLILNKLVYPAVLITLALVPFRPEITIVDSLIGGGIGLVFHLLPVVIYQGGMGWGDVKLGALVGLATGFPLVFVALLIAVVSGGTISIVLLALKLKKRSDTIPFGPFLCLGAMATLLWGSQISDWYFQLLS